MTVWRKGKDHWTVRYPIFIFDAALIFSWIAVHHALNYRKVGWIAKIFEYNFPTGAFLYTCTIFLRGEAVARVSRGLDQCPSYSGLEGVRDELEKRSVAKVEKFSYIYNKFMKLGGVSYCLMPVWRYYSSQEKDPANLLLFQSWSPLPLESWWGFTITYILQLIVVVSIFIPFGSIIIYLVTVVHSIAYQCQLISRAIVTVMERAGEAGDLGVRQELRLCVIHYQAIYRLCQEACKFFTRPINMCYYNGIFILVLCCGKLATERENKFLLFQAAFMAAAILLNQYLIAYINQIITDEIENLRIAVYDTPWYRMGIPCRKMIHMMQLMVMRKPNIKTMLGTTVDMEFFATVCNASYCYLSALLSMNINY